MTKRLTSLVLAAIMLMSVVGVISVAAQQTISPTNVYVSSMAIKGVKYTAPTTGAMRFTIASGSFSTMPSGNNWWYCCVYSYINRPIKWVPGVDGELTPGDASFILGDKTVYTTASAAAAAGRGKYADVFLKKGDVVTIILPDGITGYTSNRGGITVSVQLQPPNASFTTIPNLPYVRDPITFNASKSTPNSAIVAYSWTFGDGGKGSGKLVNHAYQTPGSYTATLTVMDKHGQTNKTSQRIVVGDKWAVVVGINKYREINDLDWSVNDANAMRTLLIQKDYFNPSHITTLTDASATKARIKNVLIGTGGLRTKVGPNDLVVFYFSGHGDQNKSHEYLCPSDSRASDNLNDIKDSEFGSWFSSISSRNTLIILDSCHSGGMSKAPARDSAGALQAAQKTFISNFVASAGIQASKYIILMACTANELADETDALQHSVFTYYLLRGFDSNVAPDTNHDKRISAEEDFAYARPRTTQWSATQHPQIYDGNLAKDLDIKYIG